MKELRLNWIDSLKFLGIFYIYLGHYGISAGKLYNFVFLFHVPLFFFVGGIFHKKHSTMTSVLNGIIDKFKKIVIPYIAFSLVFILVSTLKYNYDYAKIFDMVERFAFGIRNTLPAASLWFLPCFFVVYIYHSILEIVFKKDWLVLIASLIIFVSARIIPLYNGPAYFFNVDSALVYLLYYSLGKFLSSYILQSSKSFIMNGVGFLLAITISVLVSSYLYMFGVKDIYAISSNKYILSVINITITFSLIISSIFVSRLLVFKPFYELGRNTLVLCGTEQTIKLLITEAGSLFGIKLAPANGIQVIMLTAICFMASYYITIPIYKKIKMYTHI
ncbi:TPA: acyltransferase family protein [Escherichia coli]|nr:acyltransferase family protein [Escherichia coli]